MHIKRRREACNPDEGLAAKMGFIIFKEGEPRLGWLITMSSSFVEDQDSGKIHSCIELYFITQDGSAFQCKYKFNPYIYVATKENIEMDVDAFLRRRYPDQIANIEILAKEDLDLKNHLSGLNKCYLKISFDNTQQLLQVRSELLHVVERNLLIRDAKEVSIYSEKSKQRHPDFMDCITDIREYDVPHHVRFAIDNDVRCGQWYNISLSNGDIFLEKRTDLLQRADVRICAFDIETTKSPLKFPDATYDQVMMISYVADGKGYLIINRECVSDDIGNLEHTPRPEFETFFRVLNVKNEEELLKSWFAHIRELKAGIYVTYNGDNFDWPFVETRAERHGLKMVDEIGFQCDKNQGECRSKFACHLDCFSWVKRDSYLPQGSQGLKAVTKAKLGYDPLEVNPEDMVRFAKDNPQMMANYSVSDAVATYYLYMTYVHPFIFSLATIIPMPPDEVLRKGSGTLCEMLLMVQAYQANVICPNKHISESEKFYKNHPLESETYIGGCVECLESGVFRSDIPTSFKLDRSAYIQLITNLDRDLQYAITVEGKLDFETVINYDEVKTAILEKLGRLRDKPTLDECPLIYHLDVAAMYPNIILTNRLQPPSIVSDEVCTACDFNRPGKTCLRTLQWEWRGVTYTATKSQYYQMKMQIESEFLQLPKMELESKFIGRLKDYCQKAYKKVLCSPVTEKREAGICMRENPFYVDTVRSFRDRRYEYKGLNKLWKGKLFEAKSSENSMKIKEAQDMVILYDSLQLAHKCILNSFYGYVMRKGARWYSMEMAGVVTSTGGKIIKNARSLVEKIGKPLELDTDGIWCALPGSFPENFTFKTREQKKNFSISYPCVMLNADVARKNTNDQYQTLNDPINKTYMTHSECSIEFEVDGPYKAMIIPASKEDGILIKKRYAVFNDDGTLAELKGFEIKRRGELKLIKVFQAELFDKFLHGSNLEECYSAVASVANRWLDLLDSQGRDIADSELLDYISESSTMSKPLEEYGNKKSCAVTTAKRLADFIGADMVKDKGLRCQYIIAREPIGMSVSERALPVAIFIADAEVMKKYVRKWCRVSSYVGIRSIIDWDYYKQRLSSTIQKIVTIPAAMQKVLNPVPRVTHPGWLHKKIREKEDTFRQQKIVDMFASSKSENAVTTDEMLHGEKIDDLEDFMKKKDRTSSVTHRPIVHIYETKTENHAVNKSFHLTPSQQKMDQSQSVPNLYSRIKQNVISEEHINQNDDYLGWLEIRKRRWKGVREQNKRARLDRSNASCQNGVLEPCIGPVNHLQSHFRTGLNSYFQKHELALKCFHWQIIQLLPTLQLGQFLAWVVVDGVMLKIPVNVPRVFYLNSKAPVTEEFPGRLTNKTLPHGNRSYNVIEVVIDEEQFRLVSKKLEAHLADPEVEGIYETRVSLEFTAVLQMGCVCKVDKTAKKRNVQDVWNLSELQMKTTTECPYLEHPISYFFLYHSISGERAVFMGYFPSSSTIYVVLVHRSLTIENLNVSILEKHFHKACHAPCTESLSRKSINFKVEHVRHVNDAHRILQGRINENRNPHHGPEIAVLQCPNIQLMKTGIPALEDFPNLNIPYNTRDNLYKVVGWEIFAAKNGLQYCANSSTWLNNRITLARYAHVPLGNMEHDWLIYTADVFFSRALHDHQQALWISDNGVPDLGRAREEDSCFADEVHQPNLTYPGAYRRVSIELKIHHLAVNALLKNNHVNKIEGGALNEIYQELNISAQTNEQYCFDEDASCAPAFGILKQLIYRCLADANTSGNVFADSIVMNFYRWLCSPQSKLYDPTLHRILEKVMRKIFALLLAEFRKLGATIIFANFSKIIIDTGKLDLCAAEAYCESVLNILQNKSEFEWVVLQPLCYWHSLLYFDEYNYTGVRAIIPDCSTNNSMDIESEVQVSGWHIAEYLPKITQEHFESIVSDFVFLPWKYMQETGQSLKNNNLSTQSVTVGAAEKFESCMAKYVKELVSTHFIGRLLNIVKDIYESTTRDAALEFIRPLCYVLRFDKCCEHDIQVLERNLVRLLHLKGFEDANFDIKTYSKMSFVLPNVICSFCNDCRYLDLWREAGFSGTEEWRCQVPQCGHPYDREVMENHLIQIMRQRERLYHLQDLQCPKCKQIKAAHLSEHCACASLYNSTQHPDEHRQRMEVLNEIARRQRFQLLHELTSRILTS